MGPDDFNASISPDSLSATIQMPTSESRAIPEFRIYDGMFDAVQASTDLLELFPYESNDGKARFAKQEDCNLWNLLTTKIDICINEDELEKIKEEINIVNKRKSRIKKILNKIIGE